MSNIARKTAIIAIYVVIILMIPLFLDHLFKITVVHNKKQKIKTLAIGLAREKKKPVLIFNNNGGVICRDPELPDKWESFDGDVVDIINNLANDCCVIVASETLEYVDNLPDLFSKMVDVTGGDIFIVAIGKSTPRAFWDYKIKQLFNKTYYLPSDDHIRWSQPNLLQRRLHNIYRNVFRFVPYSSPIHDQI